MFATVISLYTLSDIEIQNQKRRVDYWPYQ